jgi:hypothetical protein
VAVRHARLDGKKVKYNLFAAQQHTISTSGHFFTQSQKGKVHAVFTIYMSKFVSFLSKYYFEASPFLENFVMYLILIPCKALSKNIYMNKFSFNKQNNALINFVGQSPFCSERIKQVKSYSRTNKSAFL